jgi:hypothetical protein
MSNAPEIRLLEIEERLRILQQEHKAALTAGNLARLDEIQIELDDLVREYHHLQTPD